MAVMKMMDYTLFRIEQEPKGESRIFNKFYTFLNQHMFVIS